MQTIDTRRGRGLLFAAVMVLMFFGSIEILLRFVGVDRPPSPRLVVRAIDIDNQLSLHASGPRALLVADSRVSAVSFWVRR